MVDLTRPFVEIFNVLIWPILQYFLNFAFGMDKILFARLFIAGVITFFLYKAALKFVKSPTISFIIALIVSILGIRMLPDSLMLMLINGYYALGILLAFIAVTMLLRSAWWIRKTLLFALAAIFGALWWFYGHDKIHLACGLICLFFLALDSYIHKMLAPLRVYKEKQEKLDADIAITKRRISELAAEGKDTKELEEELKKLIEAKTRI